MKKCANLIKIENKLIPAWKEERRKLKLAENKTENIVDRIEIGRCNNKFDLKK